MKDWTGKQKKTFWRIAAVLLCFLLLLAAEHAGLLSRLPGAAVFVLYLIPYLLIGYDVIWRAARNIAHGQVFDENFLMALATFAAFGLGLFGEASYEEALAVMLFYQIGELFQSIAVGKSRRSITEMMSIAPEYANRLREDGSMEEVDPDEVQVGDLLLVRAGEKIPLDGVVVEGESFLDTAALTGESVPRRVHPGDEVISGCVNGGVPLRIRATKEYEDSTVARILDLVENAGTRKARLENFITRFAAVYTPVVTVAALILAVLPPLLLGWSWADSVYRACNFLIVSCPCALVISVPLGFFGGIGAASRLGVLVKGSNYLEAAGSLSTLVMDKTGTLTKGEFRVTEIRPSRAFAEKTASGWNPVLSTAGSVLDEETGTVVPGPVLLALAAYGEMYSSHPVALSIREAYGGHPNTTRLTEAVETAGQGVSVRLDGRMLLVGSAALLENHGISVTDGSAVRGEREQSAGIPEQEKAGTVVYVAYDGEYAGRILIADCVRDGAAEAVAELKRAGIRRTVMLTGDREEAAQVVGRSLGIDEIHSGLLHADKVAQMERLMGGSADGEAKAVAGSEAKVLAEGETKSGVDCEAKGTAADARSRRPQPRTARRGMLGFVGDGINDAPVLMRADVGFAMGALGSDAAIEAADIVLMDDDLRKIPAVIRIARRTMRIVRGNVTFAIAVKLLILALSVFGLADMWAAVFGDVGVTVLCVINSMRILNTK